MFYLPVFIRCWPRRLEHRRKSRPQLGASEAARGPLARRTHVSDNNPYSESLFRTLKHTPAYPRVPFANIAAAQHWVNRCVSWYNEEHRHSAIRYVTPNQRHRRSELSILARRHQLYQLARRSNPRRWSRATRDWTPVGLVVLHPQRDAGQAAH